MGKVSARRGEDGNVVYDRTDLNGNAITEGRQFGSNSNYWKKEEASALSGLHAQETAAIQERSASLAGTGVTTNASGSSGSGTGNVPVQGNPGLGDEEANGDIDLSTSDTTARRKAGYRRDNGIRI